MICLFSSHPNVKRLESASGTIFKIRPFNDVVVNDGVGLLADTKGLMEGMEWCSDFEWLSSSVSDYSWNHRFGGVQKKSHKFENFLYVLHSSPSQKITKLFQKNKQQLHRGLMAITVTILAKVWLIETVILLIFPLKLWHFWNNKSTSCISFIWIEKEALVRRNQRLN